MKNSNNGYYDYFYIGTAGEYYIASKIWSLKYEAIKFPIDFGYDLAVLDCMIKSEHKPKTDVLDNSHKNIVQYYRFLSSASLKMLQIKTRHIKKLSDIQFTNNHYIEKLSNHDISYATFSLKHGELCNIIDTANSYVVFLFYTENDENELSFVKYIWLSSMQINQLYKNNYFFQIMNQDDIFNLVCYFDESDNSCGIINAFFDNIPINNINNLLEYNEVTYRRISKEQTHIKYLLQNNSDKKRLEDLFDIHK